MGRKTRFFSLEALRSIKSNAAISFAATATVLIAIATLGVFLTVFTWSRAEINAQKDKLDLSAFIKLDATEADITAAQKAVEDHPNVKSWTFKTSEQVFKEQEAELGKDIIGSLATNPFPATIVIRPDDPKNNDDIVADLSKLPYWLKDSTSPDGFSVNQKTTRDFLAASRFLRWGAFGLMVLLVIAAVLLIGNTIRLSIFARRREVEVMRLVGATNWFIRWPFVIEGLIFGLLGAIGAVIFLVLVKYAVVDRFLNIGDSPFHKTAEGVIGLAPLGVILIAAGALLGALGSGITLRRFLKV